jgi:uncharacterized protein (TIGR02099 family)
MRAAAVWVNRLLWGFIAFVVVTFGALVAIGRHYIDYLDDYQAQIVEQVSRRTGLRIELGRLDATWVRASPQFTLENLRILNPSAPQEVVLGADHMVVRVGLFQSLAHLRPVFSRVEGHGVRAVLDEDAGGRWRLRGVGGGGSADALIDVLLRIHRANLKGGVAELHFRDEGDGGDVAPAQVDVQALRLQRSGRFRRIQTSLRTGVGAPLAVIVEAQGDPRNRDRFRARAHASFPKVDPAPLLPVLRRAGVSLGAGSVDGALWLDWQPGGAISVRGDVALPALSFAAFGEQAPLLSRLSASFLWQYAAGNSQVWVPRLRATWGDAPLDLEQLYIERRADADTLNIALPRLPLEPVHRLLRAGRLLPSFEQNIIDTLSPQGELRRLRVALPLAAGQWQRLRLRGEFAGLHLVPWHDAPGVTGLSGYVDTGIAGGEVLLRSDAASLEFPRVYRQPIPFDRLQGALHWYREGDRIHVDSGPIEAQGDAGQASVLLQLNLNLHANDPVPPQMTLMVGMRNSAAQFRNLFIPYTLQPELLAWLDRAIQGARLPRGGFVYRGSLRKGDYDNRSVQLALDVRGGVIDYQPGWPPLRDLQADLWVDDVQMDIHGYRARMLDGIDLLPFEVEMRPRPQTGAWLHITGTANARDNDVLRALRESPLRQHLGDQLDNWAWQGETRTALELGIPLHAQGQQPEIRVDADLDGGTMRFDDLNLALERVVGRIAYRSHPQRGERPGLSAQGIRGQLFGRRTRIDIETGKDQAVNIGIDGRIGVSDLRDWLHQPLLDQAHGETDYRVAVRLAGERSSLQATSDLIGVAVDLPPPWAKLPATPLPFVLDMTLAGERRAQASAGEWADLALQWVRAPADSSSGSAAGVSVSSGAGATAFAQRLDSAVLRLGRTGQSVHESGRVTITGATPALDAQAWRTWLQQHRQPGTNDLRTAGAAIPLALSLRDLHLPEVTLGEHALREVRLSGQRRTDTAVPGWVLEFDADRARGQLTIPDDAGLPLDLALAELRLPAPPPVAQAETVQPDAAPPPGPDVMEPSALSHIDPADVVAADVHVTQLWRGDENWGGIGFRLRPVAHGLRLDRIEGELRGIAIRSTAKAPSMLIWQRQGEQHTTRFSGHFAAGDIAAVLERWGFERSIASKSGFVDANVYWRGAPDQIGLRRIAGEATFGLTDGQFLRASGSASGTLKIVGVFNFANLLRRLQLDFSDVFKGGVSFDAIDGHLALGDGVFSTRKPIEISSPSSHFRLSGRIDFNTDQTGMELVATLPIASNLPWVAALAGGLPAAAGVYLASKLFQEQVDHFSSAVYEIRGPWREPEVKFRRIFDDELPASGQREKSGETGRGETSP